MSDLKTADIIKLALENCASEPVHIPGIVQPFGCIIAINPEDETMAYASENTEQVIGLSAVNLLGGNAGEILGHDVMHDIRNVLGLRDISEQSTILGTREINGQSCSVSGFLSQGYFILEIERFQKPLFANSDKLMTISALMKSVLKCDTQSELFQVTVSLIRTLSGYDRVMLYRFDKDFNGEVVAESLIGKMEPFQGLRFPSWDIPAQARAIMAKIPLRIIQDVNQIAIPLLAQSDSLPPLDISLAKSRGVSPIHIEYLKNMGCQATMTLTLKVGEALWGVMSFHSTKPHVPDASLREVVTHFAQIFSSKLESIIQNDRLNLVQEVDNITSNTLKAIDSDLSIEESMPAIAPAILKVLDAQSLASLERSRVFNFGNVPEQSVLTKLLEMSEESSEDVIVHENLGKIFPELKSDLNGCAGVILVKSAENRALCIFRQETSQSIYWAGNPDKTIETDGGQHKLSPRHSFSRYLVESQGQCAEWSEQDLYFAQRIWILIRNSERRFLKNTLSRQQSIMIDELHHRVRNILALVRSVSRQSKRRYGSLTSYSRALESRIQALAAVHNITSGTRVASVSIQQMIDQEFAPYILPNVDRLVLSGPDAFLLAEFAPVFSLVIHELVTNAAKYGALSVDDGQVTVSATKTEQGVTLIWQESGGPAVTPPEERGFGTTLIESAVPHELNGRASLFFEASGVRADIFLPLKIIDQTRFSDFKVGEIPESIFAGPPESFDRSNFKGAVMVLEDNFILARDLGDDLNDMGFDPVVIMAKPQQALEFLETHTPNCAVLDVNLGEQTSEVVALKLLELNVRFVFVTGYGDQVKLDPKLSQVPIYTKPVSLGELGTGLAQILS
jgi:light-regulated signal transduction histidine kinase (bacteriophytochrome)/CheY-like chemotaxis protein